MSILEYRCNWLTVRAAVLFYLLSHYHWPLNVIARCCFIFAIAIPWYNHPIHVAPCHGCSSLFIHYLLHHEGCKPCTSQDVLHKCPCSTGLLIFKIESSGMNWGVEGKCGRCLDTLQYNSRITQLKIVSHKYFPPCFSDDDPCMLWPKRKYSCVFIPHPPSYSSIHNFHLSIRCCPSTRNP